MNRQDGAQGWRLNGALRRPPGPEQAETAAQYGEKQVLVWRRSYSDPRRSSPPTIPASLPDRRADVPREHSLRRRVAKVTVARFLPYWHERIAPEVRGRRVVIAAPATACAPW